MKLRKAVLLLAALCLTLGTLIFTVSAAEADLSGTCGEGLTWTLDSTGTLTISGTGTMEHYDTGIIPAGHWKECPAAVKKIVIQNGVQSIGNHSFTDCTNLTAVTLPDSLVSIGDAAFSWCTNLTQVTLPKNLTALGVGAFVRCENLTAITIPDGVTSISNSAFAYCYRLASVTLPKNLTGIGSNAFESCYVLDNVVLPKSLTSMGSSAFNDCESLSKIIIPDKIHYIENRTFYNCMNLKSVTLPASLYSISYQAFSECHSLESITIPSTVISLGREVFSGLRSVKKIIFEGNRPTFSITTFQDVTANAYYPANNSTWTAGALQNYGGTITWTEKIDPAITAQPKTAYARSGATATVSVKAKGLDLTYIWYYKNAGAAKFKKSSVKTANYSVKMNSTTKDREVYCVITDVLGNSVKTDTVRLRMAATVTKQPKDTGVARGATVKLTVQAVGDGLTYKWYYKDPGATKYMPAGATGKNYSFVMALARDGRKVYCLITDKYGKTVKTDVVQTGIAVKLTKQLTYTPVHYNATAKVKVAASGDGLTYTWYYKNANATRYTKTSVKTATYSVKLDNFTKNGSVYCVIRDRYGNQVKTNAVRLQMALTLIAQPESIRVPYRCNATVSVTAMGTGLTYQWYYKDPGSARFVAAAAKGSKYTVAMREARDGRRVYCVITDSFGKSVRTNTVTMHMNMW